MHYTRIPQAYFDILPQLSGADAKILLVVFRCTLGWNKNSAIISLSVMAKQTGVTTRQITESIKRIRAYGIVAIEQTTKGYRYTVNETPTPQTIEETSIEESSIPEQSIEETSIKVSKKVLPYKEKKESNTTSHDVVRKRTRKPKQVAPVEAERTALTVFREIHRLSVPIAIRDSVINQVTDLDKWTQICTEWIGKGFRPGNVTGCLQVYQQGWRTKHDSRQRQRGDVQEQRRNERMAQNLAEYDK